MSIPANHQPIHAVQWSPDGDSVRIIDQRRLPAEFVERDLRNEADVCDAIRTLAVRGAPAIGICGAMGLVLATNAGSSPGHIEACATRIAGTRPTAVNLAWALNRVVAVARSAGEREDRQQRMRIEATAILDEDRAMCRRIGEAGLTLLRDGMRVLTHCNAGALATGGIGTALAPIYLATEQGMRIEVIVDETRPLLQGSRLTAWELSRAGIPVTLITDNMAASAMRAGKVDLCLVGADRIAANGDVANKIGTYGVAVLARHHGIPFHVAGPWSTVDPATPDGAGIRIEERDPDEVRAFGGVRTAPATVTAWNPAFDVTPAGLVTSIVTDRGIVEPPYHFTA